MSNDNCGDSNRGSVGVGAGEGDHVVEVDKCAEDLDKVKIGELENSEKARDINNNVPREPGQSDTLKELMHVKTLEATTSAAAPEIGRSRHRDDVEGFLRVHGDKDEEEDKYYRRKFWGVGDTSEDVNTKTRSKIFQITPDDSHVFTTKMLVNVMVGSVKLSFPDSSGLGQIVKIFEHGTDRAQEIETICVEASPERPVTVSQGQGMDTMIINANQFKGNIPSVIEPSVIAGGTRTTISVVRIGWLKEEYAAKTAP